MGSPISRATLRLAALCIASATDWQKVGVTHATAQR
jgi:hypothetical protein